MPNKDEEAPVGDAPVAQVSEAQRAPLSNAQVPPVADESPVPPDADAVIPPVADAPAAPICDAVSPIDDAFTANFPVDDVSTEPVADSVAPVAEAPVPRVEDEAVAPVADAPVAHFVDAPVAPVTDAPVAHDADAVPPVDDVFIAHFPDDDAPVPPVADTPSISIPRPHGRQIPDVPTAATGAIPKKKLASKPSKDHGKSDNRNLPGPSGYVNPNVAGPSENQRSGAADPLSAHQGVSSSAEHRTSDPTPFGLADQAQAMHTSESMPAMPPDHPQSRSLFRRVRRYISRHLNLNFGRRRHEEDDSRHVMEPDSEGSPPPPPVELERYRPFPSSSFNYWTFYDPVLPYEEVNERCKTEWKSEMYIYERAKSLTEDISSMADFAGEQLPADSDSVDEPVVQAFEDNFVVEELENDNPVVLAVAPIPDPQMEEFDHIPDPEAGNVDPIPDPDIDELDPIPNPEVANEDLIPEAGNVAEEANILHVPDFGNVAFEPDHEPLANIPPHRVDINVVNVPDPLAGARLQIAEPVQINVADLVAAGFHDPFPRPVAPVPEVDDVENDAEPAPVEFLTLSQRVAADIAEEVRLKAYYRGSPC